jgi:hypothetical protein
MLLDAPLQKRQALKMRGLVLYFLYCRYVNAHFTNLGFYPAVAVLSLSKYLLTNSSN